MRNEGHQFIVLLIKLFRKRWYFITIFCNFLLEYAIRNRKFERDINIFQMNLALYKAKFKQPLVQRYAICLKDCASVQMDNFRPLTAVILVQPQTSSCETSDGQRFSSEYLGFLLRILSQQWSIITFLI